MRKTTVFLLCLGLALPLAAQDKDEKEPGFVGRTYHNFHAYFNGFYHAEQLYFEVTDQLEQAFEPPEVGFISLVGTERGGDIAKDQRLEQAIQKCELLLFRRDKSNFLDDARLLMGKCYFYRQDYVLAQQQLAYIPIAFPDGGLVPEAHLWLAKVFLTIEDRYSARVELDKLFAHREIEKDVRAEASLIYAQLLMDEGKYSEATKVLDDNLEALRDRTIKARAHYALGQLYQHLNVFSQAYAHYEACARLDANPGLTFRAELNRLGMTVAYQPEGGQRLSLQRELRRMLEDSRYTPYHEQVYHELAKLERKDKHFREALEYAKQGIAANQGNRIQKLRNYTLAADILFEDLKKWEAAQAYYDSAATLATVADPDFARVRALASSLGEFTRLQQTISRNDSLLALALQPDYEIERRITFKIAEEEDQRERDARAKANTTPTRTDVTASAAGGFYFDNGVAMTQGKGAFLRQWGERPNQDNWRRRNAIVQQAGTPPRQGQAQDPNSPPTEAAKAPTISQEERRRQLWAEIPLTPEAKKELSEASIEAMIGLAVLYADRLDRPDQATLLYERVVERDPKHHLAVRARYGLFLLLREWEPGASERWGDEILRDFPESDYARLVRRARNPDKTFLDLNSEEEAYQTLYSLYKGGDYTTVINFVNYQLEVSPLHPLAAKMLYLKGLSYGRQDNKDSLVSVFTHLVNAYPDSEPAATARGTLNAIANPETLNRPPQTEKAPSEELPAVEKSPYSLTLRENEQVLVVVLVSKEGVEASTLIKDFNAFNRATFPDIRLSVNRFEYQSQHMLYVNMFTTFAAADDYIRQAQQAQQLAVYLQQPGAEIFFIGYQNFRKAFTQRKFDEYLSWYLAHRSELLK